MIFKAPKIWIVACLAIIALATQLNAQDRPNIVLIMSDDMGYSDIGCYGGEIQTPNLDRLASKGVRFTQFYNTGRCCPTRASLLTGLYPHQAGVGWMINNQGVDGYRGDLNRNCVTIAEVLRETGYKNYAVGKWHVTTRNFARKEAHKHNWPLQRGFDRYYGIIKGASSLWDPTSLVRDNKEIAWPSDKEYEPKKPYHLTDAISDHAVEYIREHDDENPFFLYVSYTAAHWPMHARPRDIKKYEGVYDAGYDVTRKNRFQKMKRLGLLPANSAMTPTVGDWRKVQNIVEWEIECMKVYAAMADQMDQGIGRIVKQLKASGKLDNTLILYLQDNGGCAEPGGRDVDPKTHVARAAAPTLPKIPADENHYVESVPKQTRDGWPVRRGHVMPGPADTFIGYGKNWANVSNTPFREYKHYVHEGGIATPLIAHWPNQIKKGGGINREPSHVIDIMATIVQCANSEYPETVGEEKIKPLQGVSLVPCFSGDQLEPRNLFWEHEGNRAVRQGRWKLVSRGDVVDRELPAKWELYDLQSDPVELNNLTKSKPKLVRELGQLWIDYAHAADVYPSPDLKKKKKNKK